MNSKSNIILIGMPGCGKSSIGTVLAKALGYKFLDSDQLIQEREKRRLSELIKAHGMKEFRHRIENKVNASINVRRTVIATGGSVIYGKEAMEHLSKTGLVVYIKLPYEEIEARLGDLHERGIAIREGQTLRDLYDERIPLYEKYAHLTIEAQGLSLRETASIIRDGYFEANGKLRQMETDTRV